jgi:hypothetical protein
MTTLDLADETRHNCAERHRNGFTCLPLRRFGGANHQELRKW